MNFSLNRQCPQNTTPYQIQAGDTLFEISLKFNTTVGEILEQNPGLIPENLIIGQVICIPVPLQCPAGSIPYQIKAGDTLFFIAQNFNTTVENILSVNPGLVPERLTIGQIICIPQTQPPGPFCPSGNFYVIRFGDTFSSIAIAFNVPLEALLNANPNVDPISLFDGQVICIPKAPVPLRITISLTARILSLYVNGKFVKSYPVAIGKPSTPTPVGTFTIINKQLNPGGPFGTRWMGLSIPGYGIHGTNNPASIGNAVSSGCIRMFNQDVNDLFNRVGVGTQVIIF